VESLGWRAPGGIEQAGDGVAEPVYHILRAQRLLGEDIMIVDGADIVLRTRNPVGGRSTTVGQQRILRARISSFIGQFSLASKAILVELPE
jgi:hypothetical protein